MIILLMGVAGAGKTTVGRALAAELQWRFVDADDFHSANSVAKMRSGQPLDDADRAPWLQSLRTAISKWRENGDNVVLACSALKEAYRHLLIVGPEIRLVYLKGNYGVIERRLSERHHHYMNPELLASQFDSLEEPHDAVIIDVDQTIPEIITEIRATLDV